MAWSWPWSRDKAPPTSVPPAAPPSEAAAPAAAPAPSPMGWAFLPPIQRQLAEPIRPLSRGFEPGAWASPMFTGSMTHAVADGAPHGLIDGDGGGLGVPIQRSAAGPELTLLPPPRPRVQRSIQRATDEELAGNEADDETWQPEAWSTPNSETDDSATGDSATGDGPEDGRTGGEGRATTPLVLSRTADVRAPAAIPEPPRSLVRASPAGLPFVQRSAIADPVPTAGSPGGSSVSSALAAARPADMAASGPAPTGTSTLAPGSPAPAPLGLAGAPSPMPGPPAALPVQRMSSAAAAVPDTGRPVAGERPRLGFGPPLAQVPPTAQSSPPPDLSGSTQQAQQVQRAAIDGFTEIALPGVAAAPPKQPPAPGMPLQRTSSPDAAPLATPATPDESTTAAVEEAHPDDCADPGHGHPAAAPPVAVVAGPPDVVPEREVVVPEPPASPTMRGEVAPLHVGGLSTSIQRSSVLPGPGLPVQRLSVRPAGLPAPPSSRVVRVQRVPSSMSSQALPASPPPTTSSAGGRSPGQAAPAGATSPLSSPMGPIRAGTSPVAVSALTSPGGATSIPALQRSAATSASPSLPVVEPVGPEGQLDAGAPAVSVEYAAVPFEPGTGMAGVRSGGTGSGGTGSGRSGWGVADSVAPGPSELGSSVSVQTDLGSGYGGADGAGPAAFLQRSSAGLASSPALRASGPAAVSPLVLPQRATAAEVGSMESAIIQRAEAPEAAPQPEPEPPPTDAGASGSPAAAAPAAAAPAAGGQQSPEQAEAMARQLFPSLLRMLRGELVVDRERRGVRTDRW